MHDLMSFKPPRHARMFALMRQAAQADTVQAKRQTALDHADATLFITRARASFGLKTPQNMQVPVGAAARLLAAVKRMRPGPVLQSEYQ
ncbi:MAG: hypothetical protein ACJAVM_000365 [Sulfitobacter sp.]|jgi:hypothetical protein